MFRSYKEIIFGVLHVSNLVPLLSFFLYWNSFNTQFLPMIISCMRGMKQFLSLFGSLDLWRCHWLVWILNKQVFRLSCWVQESLTTEIFNFSTSVFFHWQNNISFCRVRTNQMKNFFFDSNTVFRKLYVLVQFTGNKFSYTLEIPNTVVYHKGLGGTCKK